MSDETDEQIPDRTILEAEYQRNSPLYQRALLLLEHRVRETLESASIRPSIKGRVKNFDSYYAKCIRIKTKAHMTGEEPVPLTDVIAIRAICPFLGDLGRAERAICAAFKVVELERKGSERSFREFGYESIHILAELPGDLVDAGAGLEKPVFEIQLRTILQEAWAEVEHELVYKAEFTPFDEPMKRKLAALNANLSLSDIIFQEILDYQRRLNSELERRRSAFHGKIEDAIDRPMNLSDDNSPLSVSKEAAFPAGDALMRLVSRPNPDQFVDMDDLLLAALEAHNREDFPRATALYTEILNQAPGKEISSVVLKHRGMAFFSQSRYENAIADFDMSLQLDPDCYKAAYYRGVVKSVLLDYVGAIADFDRALGIHPYHFYSRYRRAMAYYQVQEHTQALSDCEAALRLEPENHLVLRLRDMARAKIRL